MSDSNIFEETVLFTSRLVVEIVLLFLAWFVPALRPQHTKD